MFFHNVVQGFISKYTTVTAKEADTNGDYQQEELLTDNPERARIQEVSALKQEEESTMVCFDTAHSGDLALNASVVRSRTSINTTTGTTIGTNAILAVDTSMGKKLMEQRESSNLFSFEDGTIMNFNFASITKDSDTDSLFVEGDVWASRDLLFKATRVVANKQGFTVIRNSNQIECNRAGTVRTRKDTNEQRKIRVGQLKTGCTWQIRIKSLDKTLDLVGKKYRMQPRWYG
jgi:hypothetical protein